MSKYFGVKLPVLVLVTVSLLYSASLSAPGPAVSPGDTVSLTVSLASLGRPVSGVQFDVNWGQPLDVHVATGAQMGAASKVLSTASLGPRVLRCMIGGLNRNALADGELVRLFITVNPGAAAGVTQVTFTNLSATDPNAGPVALQASPVNVQVQSLSGAQLIQPNDVLNGASLVSGPVSPGEAITLFGSISSVTTVILCNGVPAPITYRGSDQVNAIVPYKLDVTKPAQFEIQQGMSSTKISVPVAAITPAIFTMSSTGTGQGAIRNQDTSLNSASNPAAGGSVISVYGTGFGVLNPPPADGQIVTARAPTIAPVTAVIAGVPAKVLYAGAAPGLIAGAVEIDIRVPAGLGTNPVAPISLTAGSLTTQAGVTVAIQ